MSFYGIYLIEVSGVISFGLWTELISSFAVNFKVSIKYDYVKKDTGLTQGTNDQAGQDAFNKEKASLETFRTDVDTSVKNANWREFQSTSNLELQDYDTKNYNLGPVEAYCSEEGAVVRKCDQADLNCATPPCKCAKTTGSITKCSKYITKLITLWFLC